MNITCTILYPDPKAPGHWRAPSAPLRARLIACPVPKIIRALECDEDGAMPELLPEPGDTDLWLEEGRSEGLRLSLGLECQTWKVILPAGAQPMLGARAIIATLPDDLRGALLVFFLPSELSGGALYSADLADLLGAAECTLSDPEFETYDRALAFSILCTRARAEALFAEERARRIELKSAALAAKNFVLEETTL
jgi:hypothetical protein